MKKLIYILFLISLGLAQQPEFSVNSFNLNLNEVLEVTASNLSQNSRYALTLSTPEGTLLRENPSTDAKGSLSYSRVLDSEGEWSIRLKGSDIDTQLFVTVSQTASTPQNPLSVVPSDTETATDTTATPTTSEEAVQNPLSTPESSASTPQTQEQTPEQDTPTEATEQAQIEETTESQGTEQEMPTTDTTTTNESTTQTPSTETPTPSVEETTPEETTIEEATPIVEESTLEEPILEETTLEDTTSKETSSTATKSNTVPSTVSLENSILSGKNWTLEFPENSGQTQALLEHNNAAYLGHGNSVLKVDTTTGNISQRWILSGQVTDIATNGNSLAITTDVGKGLSETFTLEDDQLIETVRFGNQPEVFGWLKNEADVTDPIARLKQDSTNPWLHLQAATSAANSAEARVNLESAVEKASTFYDLAGIGRALFATGNTDLADQAFDKALKDFAARGYDPRLLGDTALHEAYNFPLQPLKDALGEQNLDKAAFWAKWLRYFSSANVPQVQSTLSSYADLLRDKGQRTEASLWRSYARAGSQTGIISLLDNIMTSIGRLGWYGVLSLLIGLLGLALTLLFKYWEPHSLLTRRRQVAQKPTQPWSRLWAVRHYSFTEKLFVVLLLASILALTALANWNDKGKEVAKLEAFKVGTLANGLASNTLSSLPDNPRSNFIRGYAAQVTGDTASAQRFYEQAGNFAPAINNLALVTNDASLYKKALELSPGLAEARVNQGQNVGQLPFAEYTSGSVLAIPTSADVQTALANSWQNAIAKIFTNPWTGLQNTRPASIAPWLWYILLTLFLLLCLVSVLWLFIPRPKISRNAPRNFAYHLLSLLIPGSGLADEMWGILLLVPWAFIGLDILSKLFGWGLDLGLSLNWGLIALGVIYLINTIAFFVELRSYQKRMKTLKQTSPDLAREFGMRVRTS